MLLSVCPHDIVKQMQTWLDFAAYLSRCSGHNVRLRQAIDFAAFYEGLSESDIVFANPMDAWLLHTEHGFLPVARTSLYDEVVFITHPEQEAADLAALQGQPLAAVERQFATYLGLYLLGEQGIQPAAVRHFDSWLQVIRAVNNGEVPFGLLYRDFYTGLNNLSRSTFRVLHESQTGYATHMLMLNPAHREQEDLLLSCLAAMPKESDGQAVLSALGFTAWTPTRDLEKIAQIVAAAQPNP